MIYLIRHGETEWSLSGQHTGRTDIPLTAKGEDGARAIGRYLDGRKFGLVLTSPRQRAILTCRLAGYEDVAQIAPDLAEWHYGDFEGKTTNELRKLRPEWFMWNDGFPNGESIHQVAVRAQRIVDRAVEALPLGDVALFGHGHILRILTAVYLGLPPSDAKLFALRIATISTLGFERETRVIVTWNRTPH